MSEVELLKRETREKLWGGREPASPGTQRCYLGCSPIRDHPGSGAQWMGGRGLATLPAPLFRGEAVQREVWTGTLLFRPDS